MPFAAVTFTVAGFASMGLPGFSGFVAELQVLIGAWHAFPTLTLFAGVGIVVGAAYTLRAMQRAFFGGDQGLPAETALPHADDHALEPISIPERLGAAMLIGASLLIGLYPRILLDLIVPSLQSPLFQGLWKGGQP
jgi:NADH-quinone oxidoreductase subunit M